MADIKRLLELKKKIKKKNPDFVRQDYGKRAKLTKKYKKAKGIQSKMRHKKKSRYVYVQSGYRTPVLVRYLSKDGLKNVMVSNVKDLEKINPKEDGITISKIGLKNKIEIVKVAQGKKIKIFNVPENFLTIAEQKISQMKKEKAEKEKQKKEKEEKKKEVKKETKKEEAKEELSEEEKKKKEKEEKDKALIKKDAK